MERSPCDSWEWFNGRRIVPKTGPLTGSATYRKTALVRAVQMPEPFVVSTLEGTMHGEAGDYLCEGPAGDRWPIKRAIFEATYAEVIFPG